MRPIRTLTIAAAVCATLPTLAAAQRGRDFKDAWFWGIKAGGFTVADSGSNYVQAPMIGLDWLITRTHGGVYIAGSQTFFTQHTIVVDDTVGAGLRSIRLKNLRRLDVAAMGFPGDYKGWHPYIGAGFSAAEIGQATPEGIFTNPDQALVTATIIQNQKVAVTPLFIAGAQYRLRYFSVFGQLSFSPSQHQFLLYNGRPANFGYELGLRYNIGSSIDRDN